MNEPAEQMKRRMEAMTVCNKCTLLTEACPDNPRSHSSRAKPRLHPLQLREPKTERRARIATEGRRKQNRRSGTGRPPPARGRTEAAGSPPRRQERRFQLIFFPKAHRLPHPRRPAKMSSWRMSCPRVSLRDNTAFSVRTPCGVMRCRISKWQCSHISGLPPPTGQCPCVILEHKKGPDGSVENMVVKPLNAHNTRPFDAMVDNLK